jgi:N-acetylmuramoyl-L-alanine amidase
MGFISNYTEGNILDSEAGQNEIAKAISDAISYKNEYYGNGGNENSTNPTSSRNTYKVIRAAAPIKSKPVENLALKMTNSVIYNYI